MIKRNTIIHNVEKLFPLLASKLQEEKDIILAYIFGSYANNSVGPMSDVDVAVYLKETKDYFERKIDLNLLVTEILKTDEVDIVILNEAPLEFAFNVLKTGYPLFSKDEKERMDFETRIMRNYQDFAYYRVRMIEDYIKKIKAEIKNE